jgi:hypothetical protein
MNVHKRRRRIFVGDIVSFTTDVGTFIGMVTGKIETTIWEVCVTAKDRNSMHQVPREDLQHVDPKLFMIYNHR